MRGKGQVNNGGYDSWMLSVLVCDPQSRPWWGSKPGCFSSLITKWWGGTRGQSCHLPFLHIEWCHVATHHPLYFLYREAQLGRRNGTECVPVCASVCVCAHAHVVPVLCWWFTQLSGSHPGPIFSFSLHNSKRYHWSRVSCPFSSSSSSSSCSCATSCPSFPHPPPSCMCGSF